MELMEATPSQSAAMQRNVAQLQRFWEGEVLPVVAARFAWWSVMRATAKRYGITPADVVGEATARSNAEMDRVAIACARMVGALDSGEARVQPWTLEQPTREGPPMIYFGIVPAGVAPGGLGLAWLAIPAILKTTATAIAAAGVWLLADSWLQGERIEAEAAKQQALNRAKYADAINEAAKRDPGIAAQLAATLAQADALAASPGDALDRLGQAAADIGEAVGRTAKGAADMLPLIALALLLGGRK